MGLYLVECMLYETLKDGKMWRFNIEERIKTMDFVYKILIYVILPFLISFFSAWVFWILTFKYSNINIIFSDKLEKRRHARDGGGHEILYRVRLVNNGRRDLIEVSLVAKVSMTMENGKTYATHFPVGDECINPIIRRRKSDREAENDNEYCATNNVLKNYKIHYYGLYVNDIAYKEFAKEEYKSQIREKAKAKTLVVDDIFEAYPDARIVVYVFGNDSVTGARRKFESPEYRKENIMEGRFGVFYEMTELHMKLKRLKGKKKIQMLREMLSIIENK